MIYFFVHLKMNYYFFNKQQLFQKAKDRFHSCDGKKKAAEYDIANKEVLKENAKIKCRNLSEKEKEAKREYGRNRYKNMTEMEKNKLKEY